MSAQEFPIRDLGDLRSFVYSTLCNHEQLEFGAFPMTQRILVRSGRACGIFFCLHGPRSVRFIAIWETEKNTILFYNSTGERFLRVQLSESPSLALAAG